MALVGKLRFEGVRIFSRAMVWVCATLSIATVVLVVGLAALVAAIQMHPPASNSSRRIDWPEAAKQPSKPSDPAPTLKLQGPTWTTIVTSKATRKTVHLNDGSTRMVVSRPKPVIAPPAGFDPSVAAPWLAATPPLLLAAALWQGAGFFRQLVNGRPLGGPIVRKLRNFSTFGVTFLVADSFLEPAFNATLKLFGDYTIRVTPSYLTYGLPSAQTTWILSGSNLMLIVFAAVLIAMVSVLARAAAIAEDHAQIV